MPVKNDDSDGDIPSGGETENSSQAQSSDEEANEIESDDSSEMDANEIESQRITLMDHITAVERQFSTLREQYYNHRINQIERQLADLRSGRSEEFLQPLKELDKVYHARIEVAEKLRQYRLENIEHKFLSEEQAAQQHYESEKQLAYDNMHDELLEKMRRLEEDRHNVDISWANWSTDKRTSKVRGPGRKKAVTVTGPYIIYLLPEEQIIEDWTTIRKALKRSAATAGVVNAGPT